MFARTEVQSRGWRIFAIVAIIFTAPILLAPGSSAAWAKTAAASVALFGLAGFAFGFRVGPLIFWRIFSALFALGLMVQLGRQAAPWVHGVPAAQDKPATILLGFALFAALCVALFRHSQFVPTKASPAVERRPQPLFLNRAEQWHELHQRIAEQRTEMERPLSANMQAEALSYGPARQLSLKEYQRISTCLFLGTIAAQVVWALLGGGLSAIIVPAFALALTSAAATYCSAELILKSRKRLAKAWKGALIVIAFVLLSFLVGDPASVKLWLARAVGTSGAALILGNILVTTYYSATRKT